jgi:hypothetical protein
MILAIDDDPGRYEHLGRLLGSRADLRLVVGCCPRCVRAHLRTAAAVLLDHDLDGAAACSCGLPQQHDDTRVYLPWVADLKLPTIVTSASSRANVRHLVQQLVQAGVPQVSISAIETDPELRWLGWLWLQGVL